MEKFAIGDYVWWCALDSMFDDLPRSWGIVVGFSNGNYSGVNVHWHVAAGHYTRTELASRLVKMDLLDRLVRTVEEGGV